MKLYKIRVGVKFSVLPLYEERTHRHTQTEGRRPYEDRIRDWGNAAISPGMPRTSRSHQKPGRGKERFFLRPFLYRELGPANILISELGDNTFLLF